MSITNVTHFHAAAGQEHLLVELTHQPALRPRRSSTWPSAAITSLWRTFVADSVTDARTERAIIGRWPGLPACNGLRAKPKLSHRTGRMGSLSVRFKRREDLTGCDHDEPDGERDEAF